MNTNLINFLAVSTISVIAFLSVQYAIQVYCCDENYEDDFEGSSSEEEIPEEFPKPSAPPEGR